MLRHERRDRRISDAHRSFAEVTRDAGETSSAPPDAMRPLVTLVVLIVAASLPVIVDRSAIQSAASMHALADSANPYWLPRFAPLLYLRVPLVTLSAIALLLAPGVLLASALGATADWGRWVLASIALALVVVSASAGVVQFATGEPLRGGAFLLVIGVCAAASGALAWRSAVRGRAMLPPHSPGPTIDATVALAILAAALVPKLLWENFNGDGVSAFETARLLLRKPLPFWNPAAGPELAGFPGVTSMLFAYPASWFIRIFGETEAAARLPFLIGLLGVFAGILTLASAGRPSPPGRPARVLVWGALAVYAVTVAYSATYSPYSADIAMPAAQDTLMVAMFMGVMCAAVTGAAGWLALFAVLSYVALPSAIPLLGMLVIALVAVWRPVPWRTIAVLAGTVVLCIIAGAALMRIDASGSARPGGEYGMAALLDRLLVIQFGDWRRVLYVVVPSGIAPALALLFWSRQDAIARVITLVTVQYFAFTYLQAYAVLHYYIPAMIFPVAVFWRIAPAGPRAGLAWRAAAVAGLGIALTVAIPRDRPPFTAARHVARRIQIRVPGYGESNPAALRAATALHLVFPYDWDRRVPSVLASSPLVWGYYARGSGGSRIRPDYIVQPDTSRAPAGFHGIGQYETFSVYVRDDSAWARDLRLRPPSPAASPIFRIAPDVAFRYATTTNGAAIHDLRPYARRYGGRLLALLGVH